MIYSILLLCLMTTTHLFALSGFVSGSADGGASVNTTEPTEETVLTEDASTLTDTIPAEYIEMRSRLNLAIAQAVSAQSSEDVVAISPVTETEVDGVIDEYPADDNDLHTLRTNLDLALDALAAYFDLVGKEADRSAKAHAIQDYDPATAPASLSDTEKHAAATEHALNNYASAMALESFTEAEETAIMQKFASAPPLATLLLPESTGFHRETLNKVKEAVNPIVAAMQTYYSLMKKKIDYVAAARIAVNANPLTTSNPAGLPPKPDGHYLQAVQIALERAQMRADSRYTTANVIITQSNSAEDGINQFFTMKAATVVPSGGFSATNINPLTSSNPHGLPVAKSNEELQALVTLLTDAGLDNRASEIHTSVTAFNTAIQVRRDALIGVTDQAINRLTSVIALEDVGDGNALRVGPSSMTALLDLPDTSIYRSVDDDDDPATDPIREVVQARKQLTLAAQSSDGIQIHLIDSSNNEYRLLINAEGIYRVAPLVGPDGTTVLNTDGSILYEQATRPFNTSINFSQHPDDGTLHDSAYQLEIQQIVETLTTTETDAEGNETEITSEKVHIILHLTQQLRNESEYGTLKRRAHTSFSIDVADGTVASDYLPTRYRVGSNATALTVEMLAELPEQIDALPVVEEEPALEQQEAFDVTSSAMQQKGGYFGRSAYGRRAKHTVR